MWSVSVQGAYAERLCEARVWNANVERVNDRTRRRACRLEMHPRSAAWAARCSSRIISCDAMGGGLRCATACIKEIDVAADLVPCDGRWPAIPTEATLPYTSPAAVPHSASCTGAHTLLFLSRTQA